MSLRDLEVVRGRETSLFSYNEVIIIITFNLCCIGNVFFTPGTFMCFMSFDLKNKSVIKACVYHLDCIWAHVFVWACVYLCTRASVSCALFT